MANWFRAAVALCALATVDSNMLCGTLNNKFLERVMTGRVCKKMERLNATIPHCQESAEHVWDYAAKMCPKGKDLFNSFCKIAGNKQMEDKMVGDVCAKVAEFQKEKFNMTMPVELCQTLSENVWDLAVPLCPQAEPLHSMLSQAAPSSTDSIDNNLLCGTLNNKFLERVMTGRVCKKMERLNATIPHCQESAEHVWDYAAKMCPKGKDLFNSFCKIAGNKQTEDKMVGDVCAKVAEFQKQKFNMTMPVELCQTLSENVWDLAVPLCPKEEALSAPAHPGSSDWLGKTVPENIIV